MPARYSLDDLPDEIRVRIVVNPATGCWEWQFTRRSAIPDIRRYGTITWEGRQERVYRLTYRLLAEPVPDGMELDHVYARGCRSDACCWPAHLEPVSSIENRRRCGLANVVAGVAQTVQRRIALGTAAEDEMALADACWALPFPAIGDTGIPKRKRLVSEMMPSFYGVAEAAEMVGVTLDDLRVWRHNKTGPPCFWLRSRALWLYPAAELHAYLEAAA